MKDNNGTPKWAMPATVSLAVLLFFEYAIYQILKSGGNQLMWVVLGLEVITLAAIVTLIVVMGIKAYKLADKDEKAELDREVEGEVVKVLRSSQQGTAINRDKLEKKVKKRRALKLANHKSLEENLGEQYKLEQRADRFTCLALILMAICVFGVAYWWQAYGQYGVYEAIRNIKGFVLAILCILGAYIDILLWSDARLIKKAAIEGYLKENEEWELSKSKRDRQKIEKGKVKYTKEPKDKGM